MLRASETHCYNHDPKRVKERALAGAVRHQPGDPGSELGEIKGIARKAAQVFEDLESYVEVEDDETGEVIKVLPLLEAARANAKLNVLRFLAQLVRLRTQPAKRPGFGGVPGESGGGGEPSDLEDLLQ